MKRLCAHEVNERNTNKNIIIFNCLCKPSSRINIFVSFAKTLISFSMQLLCHILTVFVRLLLIRMQSRDSARTYNMLFLFLYQKCAELKAIITIKSFVYLSLSKHQICVMCVCFKYFYRECKCEKISRNE